MADPNNSGINASGPFGMEPADTQIGAFGQGMLKIPSWLTEINKDIGEAMYEAPGQIIDYLGSPTEAGQAKIDLAEQVSQFGDIEAEADQPIMFVGGPEGEFAGMGVDQEVDDIATTLAEISATQAIDRKMNADNSMPSQEQAPITQDQADEGFLSAMDDFLESARGSGPGKPKERTIEEYKKVFSEATGIDTSGKVDKKDALMAFGLALMQNKAGKGFNVGKMLTSVGEAGDKAMPALQRAKNEAKKAGLAAGQYALGAKNSDMAKDEANAEKAKQRSDYYIVPKSTGISGFIANMDEGQLEALNSFELDALMTNKSFQEKFDVLPGSTWSGIVSEAMKAPEAEQFWDTKAPRKIELFGEGAGDMFSIETWRALPQSGKDNKLVGSGQDAYEGLSRAARDMGMAREKFAGAFGLIEGTSAFRFSLDKVDSMAAAFGVNFKEGTNSTERLKLFLTKLQAKNAKEILGEAGKTISDADRALVAAIVGDVDIWSNQELLEQKTTELFQEIIIKKERDILDALTTLDRYSGRKIASRLGDGSDLSPEERAELDAATAAIGEKNG